MHLKGDQKYLLFFESGKKDASFGSLKERHTDDTDWTDGHGYN